MWEKQWATAYVFVFSCPVMTFFCSGWEADPATDEIAKSSLLVREAAEKRVTANRTTAALCSSLATSTMSGCQTSLASSFHNLGVLDVHVLKKTCLSKCPD